MPSVLVTGAARGIGKSIVEHLASRDWDVIAGVRSQHDADALRMELRPWHIPVVLVEPAQTDTDMWRTADTMAVETEAGLIPEHRTLYAKHIAGMKKRIPVSQEMAVPAEKVSAVVEEALTARRPRARYVVGVGPKLQVALLTNLPKRVRDRVLRVASGQP
jgi:short-subunit dehydrogenase